MADRILRDEIWMSERFLDLPTDAARLAFIRFLSVVDDFGNFEGGPRRIFRMLHSCTQIKTEESAAACVDSLMACDLIRRYEVDGKELFHVPRFKCLRTWLWRRYPASPWCEDMQELGKHKRPKKQARKKIKTTTILTRSTSDNTRGRGSGSGSGLVLQKQKPLASSDESLSAGGVVEIVGKIPLASKKEWCVSAEYLRELEEAYPAVDGPATLKEIRAWCVSNPTKCKTERGITRFLNAWFERVQNGS